MTVLLSRTSTQRYGTASPGSVEMPVPEKIRFHF